MSNFNDRLKQLVKAAARSLGYEITRYHPALSESAKLAATLRHFGIDIVFDVGANVGQYGKALRQAGYKGRIISFEPIADAHEELVAAASHDALWTIHPKCAVGNTQGEVLINISKNSVSSSIRAMLPSHTEAEPLSEYVAVERAEVITFDSIFKKYRSAVETAWLKIDTQGFENEVLEGAAGSLPFIRAIQLELSLVPLYESQHLWDHFLSSMQKQGFDVWSLVPAFTDPRTGRSLQIDAVFARS